MFRQSSRSSKSLVLSFALCLGAASGLTGCSQSEPESQGPEVENVRVDAAELSKLQPGELYTIDITRSNVVYHISYRDAAIDFSRIVVDLGLSEDFPLEAQMAAVEAGNYGDNPKPDLLAAADQKFSISSDPAAFGVLSEAELEDLKDMGYVYQYTNGKPTSQPQSTDNCIIGYCEICIDPQTGALWDWSRAGTPLCIVEEHKWCD